MIINTIIDMRTTFLLLMSIAIASLGSVPVKAQSFSRQVPHLVVLNDGSIIPCAVIKLTKDQAQLARLSAPELLNVPASSLAGIVFSRPASDADEDVLVNQILQNEVKTDTVIDAAGAVFTGVFEQLDGFQLSWNSLDGRETISITQARAIIFARKKGKSANKNHQEINNAPSRHDSNSLNSHSQLFTFTTADGAIFHALSMEVVNETVTVIFPWDKTPYVFKRSDLVTTVLPFNGEWLDELSPTQTAQAPFWSTPLLPFHPNAGINFGCLRANSGRCFLHGFSVEAATRLTFKLDDNKKYSRLTGYAARPSDVKTGAVRFRVFTNGALAGTWILNAQDAPKEISVPLTGIKRLDLVVDFADDSPVDDRAIWGEMKLETDKAL